LPDELYFAAKTRAASQRRSVKDLVTQGLKLVVETAEEDAGELQAARQEALAALDEIMLCPPSPAGRTRQLQSEVAALRSAGWSRS
jgi:plasmid stability protein